MNLQSSVGLGVRPVVLVDTLVPVHCRGCGRKVAEAPQDFRAFCNRICAEDFPISQHEARDSLIETVYGAETPPTKTDIAAAFGVTRQRVTQIINERDVTRKS